MTTLTFDLFTMPEWAALLQANNGVVPHREPWVYVGPVREGNRLLECVAGLGEMVRSGGIYECDYESMVGRVAALPEEEQLRLRHLVIQFWEALRLKGGMAKDGEEQIRRLIALPAADLAAAAGRTIDAWNPPLPAAASA